MVFAFSWQKSFTHHGRTVVSALGIINTEEAYCDDDGLIIPAFKCWSINVPQASLNFRGQG